MFLQRTKCILCGEHINKIKYNLKTTYTETSNVLMIKFVEKLYRNVFLMHCNICSLCYEFLNELDNVQARQKELYNKLKGYIAKMQDSPFQSDIKNEDYSEETSYIYDDLKTHESLLESDDIKIDEIDLKKLPIKVKRVTTGIGEPRRQSSRRDNVYKVELDSNPKASSSQDQEAFEKIQSSIQMDLSKHVVEHMSKQKPTKNVLCEICGQHFKTKIGFENHVKKHDDAEDDMKILVMKKHISEYPCQFCCKVFQQKGALARHLYIHTGETRYQCEECGKKFVHHSSFNMHRKIHLGQRNFKCMTCNKGFLSRSHLKRHLRAAHSSEKGHCCGICGKRFTENYNLVAHMKAVHKEPVTDVFYDVKGEEDGVFYDM